VAPKREAAKRTAIQRTARWQTGKTVKERVCFYSFYFRSQQEFTVFISFSFSEVQPIHRLMPAFSAREETRPAGWHFRPRFSWLLRAAVCASSIL
jgi:hypothetical protein